MKCGRSRLLPFSIRRYAATLRQQVGLSPRFDDLAFCHQRLKQITEQAQRLTALDDERLQTEARDLAGTSASPHELATATFALVREVSHRVLNQRPFDVQILAGLAMLDGNIIEMQTGEGKTLAAVAPAVTHALSGRSVHILTFNDYLARRDAEWMGDIYRFFGLRVGYIQQHMTTEERRHAYAADVTYATAKEAGFDFLRDGLVFDEGQLVHRRLDVAIVDEADSILIDEARIPLVIAGGVEGASDPVQHLTRVVGELAADTDYIVDAENRTVHLTDIGLDRAEALLGGLVLHDADQLETLVALNAALHAATIMRRDVDYIVRHGRVEIVDEFTGRVVDDRHWPDGLQAAIEAKENVRPSTEGRILGQVTLQHFLGQYQHLAGMTATAVVSASELLEVYGLNVRAIPPNRPCRRDDRDNLVFADGAARDAAVIEEIRRVHESGRPILVGTASVAASEHLASQLLDAGIACNILNAWRDAEEAMIIADAGQPGRVTISTNMAGRGTDIRLGGSDESGRDTALRLCGLYVIGTNLHESRRVDSQLRGRSGRQGDPGASCFFVSLTDDLMQTHRLHELIGSSATASAGVHGPIDDPRVLREVDRIQRIAEGWSYDVRRALLDYGQITEQQRQFVYQARREALQQASTSAAGLQHLVVLDELWAEHLALVAEIREGIHLVGVGGMSPVQEFTREVITAFDGFFEQVDERLASRDTADIPQQRGPSSTWSYLLEDDVFENRIAAALVGNRDIGFSAGAALMGPLLAIWAWLRRRQRRQ